MRKRNDAHLDNRHGVTSLFFLLNQTVAMLYCASVHKQAGYVMKVI